MTSMELHIDVSGVMNYFARVRGGLPGAIDEINKQLAAETLATMKPITPVAVKKWTPETVIGQLRNSIEAVRVGSEYHVGPTARHRGFPYGFAVEAGIRWRKEPAQAGPRPFVTQWTYREMALKAEPMARRVIEKLIAGAG